LQKELDAKKADREKEEKEREASIEREKEGQLREQRKQTYQRGALTDQTKTFTSFLKELHSKLETERDDKKRKDDEKSEASSLAGLPYLPFINFVKVDTFLKSLKTLSESKSPFEDTFQFLLTILGDAELIIETDKVVLDVSARELPIDQIEKIDITSLIQEIDNVMKTKQFTQTYENSAQIGSNIQNLKQKGMFTELLDKFLAREGTGRRRPYLAFPQGWRFPKVGVPQVERKN